MADVKKELESGAPPAAQQSVDLETVRQFWNQNPLFDGETHLQPGEKEFFEEHERSALHEYSGKLPRIFTRDVGPGRKTLDVGCGIGFWVHQFCRLGADVSACDLTERAVELTSRRLSYFGFHADVRQGNAEQLPYVDNSFDHVNCQGVIHHTPDTQSCIQEFHRILKPGGTLCFSVYLKIFVMRHPRLFRSVMGVARRVIVLRGRGRDNMLFSATPEDLVRLYDGRENPLGKAYTLAEIRKMLAGRFRILEKTRVVFPRRAFPFAMPDWAHGWLAGNFGLMIVLRCQKT